jgi:HTH-type transcriptional regulator, competence development regulator
MAGTGEKFGAFVRRERERKEIGLREMAKMIGVSPTYMSKVERDEFPAPAEDKVRAIANIIRCDVDELLALAGRVSSDVTDIIKAPDRRTGGAPSHHEGVLGRTIRPSCPPSAESEG